jgi:protein SCO1/2
MQRPLLVAAVVLLAGVLAWMLLVWEPVWQPVSEPVPGGEADERHQALKLAAPPKGGDFQLDSAAGPVDLADLRGQVVLIYFGYTWCPDICPTNLAFIAGALKMLTPQELERVQVLFVSVDPERDTPERLAQYTAWFHPRIRGLTGSPERIAAAAKLYGAAYRRVDGAGSAMAYLVDHSASTYAVDPEGRLRRTLDHATPPDTIVALVRELLTGEPKTPL